MLSGKQWTQPNSGTEGVPCVVCWADRHAGRELGAICTRAKERRVPLALYHPTLVNISDFPLHALQARCPSSLQERVRQSNPSLPAGEHCRLGELIREEAGARSVACQISALSRYES